MRRNLTAASGQLGDDFTRHIMLAMNFASIDFETANEKRNSACAIGIAIVEEGVIVSRESYLIRPAELRFSYYNTEVHGLTEEDVEDAPTLVELWPEVHRKLSGRLIVAHNASFDMSVLRYSLHENGLPFPELKYLCSYKLASRVWMNLASHRLSFLADHHGIELDHHDPKSDAAAAAQVVLIAARENSLSCPYTLAERFDVTVGQITADGSWVPSSAPQIGGRGMVLELSLPDGFDITQHPLYGKKVVFTGTMKLPRSNAEQLVEQVGGSAKSSVSKKTDYLVCGAQDLRKLANGATDSTKLQTAKSLREAGAAVQIIGEDEFLRILTEPSNNAIGRC